MISASGAHISAQFFHPFFSDYGFYALATLVIPQAHGYNVIACLVAFKNLSIKSPSG